MNDMNRVGHHGQHHTIRNNAAASAAHFHNNLEPCNQIDVLVNSESAHIQEFRLYRELSREIEKNTNDRVRYIDSELYQRNQQAPDSRYSNPASSSEVQSATLNIGLSTQQANSKANHSKIKPTQSAPSQYNKIPHANDEDKSSFGGDQSAANGHRNNQTQNSTSNSSDNHGKNNKAVFLDGNCQVCLIKGLRDDLTHVTRVIQEKNEQLLSELKAKRSRAFFERLDQ